METGSRPFGTLAAMLLSIASISLRAQVNVTTYHNDNVRTGQFTQESILTPSNVNSSQFGKLFTTAVDGWVYAQPLYLSNVAIDGGTHNVMYVATEHDSLYAIDADTGAIYWRVSLIAPGGSTIGSIADLNCGDLTPEIGITGTPVIDINTGTIYVVASSKVGSGYYQYLHALDISTAVEKFGAPINIQATATGKAADGDGTTLTFSTLHESQRAGLLLENGHVVIGWASHCDQSPWHGWVMSYNATTLAQEAVYNTSPNGYGNGVWLSNSGMAADASGNIYFATGNGSWNGTTDLGDSLVKLGPPSGGKFPLADYFTPYNQASLANNDQDVASTGPVLLPPLTNGKQLIALQAKEGKIYLLDSSNLGKFCPNQTPACSGADSQIVQEIPHATVGIWGAPAYWNGYVYWGAANKDTGVADHITAFSFNNNNSGLLSTTATSKSAATFGFSAPQPSISANGTANGILWGVDDSRSYTQCNGNVNCQILYAYDATNLATMLYNSNQAANNRDVPGGAVKWTTPIIANGKVYIGSQYAVSGFGLLSATPKTATPNFSPAPGTYTAAQSVTLADSTSGAVIYYTTDGSTPTSNSTKYSAALPIAATKTIKAVASAGNYLLSAVASGTYTISTPQAAAPAFSPAAGTYTSTQSVKLTDSTAGATIYYTVNGTTPTTSSAVYSAPITVAATTTIKALATATGYTNSAVASGTFTMASANNAPVNVALSSAANVYAIANDGTGPAGGGMDGFGSAYSATLLGSSVTWSGVTFAMGGAATLDAASGGTIAVPANNYSTMYLLATAVHGNAASQKFVVTYTDDTTSTFTQNLSDWHTPQSFAGESTAVTMPYRVLANGTLDNRTFYLYGYSFTINSAKTVQSLTLPNNRDVITLAIDFVPSAPTTLDPTISPVPGTYTAAQSVTLADGTSGAAIYYTTDGRTPTTGSTKYSAALPIAVTTTIKALAAASGYANSAVTSGAYTITLPTVAAPALSPAAGSYAATQSVTITDSTAGATIHYTVNGTTPTTSSAVYNAPITIAATTTIKALATATGYTNSAVASGTFTIASANNVPVNVALSSAANVYAIANDGTIPAGGGMDSFGSAYSATLLGSSVTWSGVTFAMGGAATLDAASGGTIVVPANNYSTMYLLATAVNGNAASQKFVVTYTDGTTSTFTQSLSDWHTPQSFAGESVAVTMPYRVLAKGTRDNRAFYLYGYSFAIDSARTVQSLTLPNNRNIVTLAIDFLPSAATATAPTFSPAPGTYTAALSVTLADSMSGAIIYYTTDGSTPTTGSTKYSAALPIAATTTIKALAAASGYANSAVSSGTFMITPLKVATPVLSPVPGIYTATQSVLLTDGTASATIYYTIDGTTPTTSSAVYTAPITVAATMTIKALATAAGCTNSTVAGGTYSITLPGSTASVAFGTAGNVYGVANDGSPVLHWGIDGSGHAYSAALLGSSATWAGISFSFGAAGIADAASDTTLALPASSFSKLYMLATGVNGNQVNQVFVVTYTDGTISTITQSLSDWRTPQNFIGETQALSYAYRLNPDGSTDNRTFYLYGYTLAIDNTKTLKSITLPSTNSVVLLALTLGS